MAGRDSGSATSPEARSVIPGWAALDHALPRPEPGGRTQPGSGPERQKSTSHGSFQSSIAVRGDGASRGWSRQNVPPRP